MHILRENRRDRQYKDLVKFLVFVVIFVMIQFELRSVFDAHFQNAGLRELLVNEWLAEPDPPEVQYADMRSYNDVANWEEFFLWLEGPFSSVMFADTYYNGQSLGNYTSSGAPRRFFGTQTHILGKIYMRQIRSMPVEKEVLKGGETYQVFPDFTSAEYVPHNAANGTVHPIYGTYMDNALSKLEGVSTGPATWTDYGRSGWLHLFPHDGENATKMIAALKEGLYVDQATRVVTVEFNLMNPASNVITTVRLLFESTIQGVMRHKAFIMAMPTNMYRTTRHLLRAGLEGIFFIFLVYLTGVEIREAIHHKAALYCASIWNRLEVLNLIGFWTGIMVHFYFVSQWSWGGVNWTHTEYFDIYDLGYIFQLNARLAAGNTLLAFLKVFKYLQVSDRFNLLWITLGKAMHDLVSFLVIFSLFMIGFGIVGMLIFGPDIEAYSTMTQTLLTRFQMRAEPGRNRPISRALASPTVGPYHSRPFRALGPPTPYEI